MYKIVAIVISKFGIKTEPKVQEDFFSRAFVPVNIVCESEIDISNYLIFYLFNHYLTTFKDIFE